MAGVSNAGRGTISRNRSLRILALWVLSGAAIILLAVYTIGEARAQQSPASAIFVPMSNPCVPGGYELYTCGNGTVDFESGELEMTWFRFNGVAGWEYDIRGIAGPTTELSTFGSDASSPRRRHSPDP